MNSLYEALSTIPDRLASTDCSDLSRPERVKLLLELTVTLTQENAPKSGVWLLLRPMLSGMRSAVSRSSVGEEEAEWLIRMLSDTAEWLEKGTVGVPLNPPIALHSSARPEAEKPFLPLAIFEGSRTS